MSEPGPDRLGAELQELRKHSKLSQRRLARLAGISSTRLGQLERGIDDRGIRPLPRPETLRMLARGLATNREDQVDELLAGELYERLLVAVGYARSKTAAERSAADGPGLDDQPGVAVDVERLLEDLGRELLAVEPRQRAAVVRALRAFVAALANPDRKPAAG